MSTGVHERTTLKTAQTLIEIHLTLQAHQEALYAILPLPLCSTQSTLKIVVRKQIFVVRV